MKTPFPSPLPSLLGRGRILYRFTENQTVGFATRILEKIKRRIAVPSPWGEGQGEGEQNIPTIHFYRLKTCALIFLCFAFAISTRASSLDQSVNPLHLQSADGFFRSDISGMLDFE